MNKLKVYEYNQIKSLIKKLLNVYRTNDMTSHKSHKEYILNDIKNVFEANDMDSSEFISELDDIKISKKKTELLLEKLKADVEDFELPSKKEVDKLFKKEIGRASCRERVKKEEGGAAVKEKKEM